jgi:molybdate transport system ATP-binding protein
LDLLDRRAGWTARAGTSAQVRVGSAPFRIAKNAVVLPVLFVLFCGPHMALPLIQLENVDVAIEGRTILSGITWRLRRGEHWAVSGANGSGKSTFLKLLRGELCPAASGRGKRVYALDGTPQITAIGIRERIALVSPELQQRYLQQEWRLTGRQVVLSGFGGGDYVYQRLTAAQERRADALLEMLAADHLAARNVQDVSTGELRRLLIARALAPTPQVLICDEICDGLDDTGRMILLRALERAACNGTQLLYTTHRNDERVSALTHRLVMKSGRIAEQGSIDRPRSELVRFRISRTRMTSLAARNKNLPPSDSPLRGKVAKLVNAQTLIKFERASVYLGCTAVLHNLDWTLRAGEHWAILGPNGAGKSTFLKLLCGDVHPALGGRVRRFDFTTGNSLWEVKRRFGLVSPELQANYRDDVTGEELVASGYFSSIGLMRRRVSAQQQERVREVMQKLRLLSLRKESVQTISFGEFRKLLLARALVHQPDVLLFDEPFDGLDAPARASMARALTSAARRGSTLVVVSHHGDDLPRCVTHVARLANGRIMTQGPVGPL